MAFLTFLESQRDQSPWIWTQKEAAEANFTDWTGTEWTFWITQGNAPDRKTSWDSSSLTMLFSELNNELLKLYNWLQRKNLLYFLWRSHRFLSSFPSLELCCEEKNQSCWFYFPCRIRRLPDPLISSFARRSIPAFTSFLLKIFFMSLIVFFNFSLLLPAVFRQMCNSKHPPPDEASLPIHPIATGTLTELFPLPQLHTLFAFLIIRTSKQKLE